MFKQSYYYVLALYLLMIGFCSVLNSGCTQNAAHEEVIIPVVKEAFPHLSFDRPVDLQHAGDGSNRIFVVEQAGIISAFQNDTSVTEKIAFLNIKDRVNDEKLEQGLLGLAFHPHYTTNGYFYVNYTAASPNRTVISRFQVSPNNPDNALAESELILLEFEQPYDNHNGGQVAFGPDGYLYIAVGDGGSGGDPQGNGQNLKTLLGTILRIDVDQQEEGLNYAIPPDNPFAHNTDGYRKEIFAYGLRNPWRMSFDPETQWLWTGDVGQNQYEEIDIIEKGGNYGWRAMEGFHSFNPEGYDTTAFIKPVWEYDREQGNSITGGFVYRGKTLKPLAGKYIYADYIRGTIWGLDTRDLEKPVNEEIAKVSFMISSFGVDESNEVYICGFDGKIHKLTH
jgi:glucose/arabinose dehydrogenase